MAGNKRAKPLDGYLPPKKNPKKLFQTNVDRELLDRINVLREEREVTWQDLIEAYFLRDLDESKEEKR